MQKLVRIILMFAAALLMLIAALVYTFVSTPHLNEDLLEIGVRATLVRAIMLSLYFGAFAMFALTALVLLAAIHSLRGAVVSRLPLCLIALLYLAFGVFAFVMSGSHHTLGYVLIGLLILSAALVPGSRVPLKNAA